MSEFTVQGKILQKIMQQLKLGHQKCQKNFTQSEWLLDIMTKITTFLFIQGKLKMQIQEKLKLQEKMELECMQLEMGQSLLITEKYICQGKIR